MKRAEFKAYQKRIVDQFQSILRRAEKGKFDEQGVPAYTNPNPLMRWLFWQRVWHVIQKLERRSHPGAVLDFGAGLGVMLPYLMERASKVVVVDIDTCMLEVIAEENGWKDLTILNRLKQIEPGQQPFDVILALDVLEHVNDLPQVIGQLEGILSAEGRLYVSGPSENLWYRIGRKLAGYSGNYHYTNIHSILKEMEQHFTILDRKYLYPPFNFFVVASASKKKVER